MFNHHVAEFLWKPVKGIARSRWHFYSLAERAALSVKFRLRTLCSFEECRQSRYVERVSYKELVSHIVDPPTLSATIYCWVTRRVTVVIGYFVSSVGDPIGDVRKIRSSNAHFQYSPIRLKTVRVEQWMSVIEAAEYRRFDLGTPMAFGENTAIVLGFDAFVDETCKMIFASALEVFIVRLGRPTFGEVMMCVIVERDELHCIAVSHLSCGDRVAVPSETRNAVGSSNVLIEKIPRRGAFCKHGGASGHRLIPSQVGSRFLVVRLITYPCKKLLVFFSIARRPRSDVFFGRNFISS
jgi:hypothetical protein